MLTILEELPEYKLRAMCDCGKLVITKKDYMRRSYSKSCGCMKRACLDPVINTFESRDPSAMYWAGFIAADGCVNKWKLRVTIKQSDLDHLNKLKNLLGVKTSLYFNSINNSFLFGASSKKMIDDLSAYGITPRKSLTYSPPLFCEESRDFWRGMVDGDGYICKTSPIITLCGTIDTCNSFSRFVSCFCDSQASVIPNKNIFRVTYNGRYAKQVINKLYGNNPKFYLDRKYELANKFCNFALADDSGIN